MVVHGDDFATLGKEAELNWLVQQFEKRFEIKHRGHIGPWADDDKQIQILNRIVEWINNGITYEADSRQAEIIIDTLGLNSKTKGSPIPGSREDFLEDSSRLGPRDATHTWSKKSPKEFSIK